MKAEEFREIEGYWNGKLYSDNRAYKNNLQYVIDDPENLELKKEPEKKIFYDYFKDVQEKVSCMVEAYNSFGAPHPAIKGSNHRSEVIGDPFYMRHKLEGMIEDLLLLEKKINNELENV